MIRFPCRCGHFIQVDDDQAGADAQCPNCGLLNTVPALHDMGRIDEDGTYKMDDDAAARAGSPERLETLRRAFTRNTTDRDGSEIDLRATADDLAMAGDIPLADERMHETPKYDPVSGELVRPLDVVPNDRPREADIPMAKAAITYAAAIPRPTNLAGAAALLTSPGNLAVLGIMFVMHLMMQAIVAVASIGFIFVLIFGIFFIFGVLGHYANVIDEIGPRDMDELPRPLRDLQIGEDLWMPFVHVFVAMALCFGPALVVIQKFHGHQALQFVAIAVSLGAGLLALPAVLLTTSASGSFLNLRPDRVLTVAKADFASYVGLCVLGAVALIVYFAGFTATTLWLFLSESMRPKWMTAIVSYPLLCVGIYLAHLFVWQCALYYRGHHATFNWVYQRHVRANKGDQVALNDARRKVARHEREVRREFRKATRHVGPW